MTTELNQRDRATAALARPAVGLRPVPRSAPPAISWQQPSAEFAGHPELPWTLEGTESVDVRQGGQTGEAETSLPNPAEWSSWLAQLLVEVVHGRRPVNQLARWTEERVLATVVLRSRQLRSGPTRRVVGTARPAALSSIRVQCPTAYAVEATAVIRGARASALAFRLEARGDRWLCTAVDFGPQTPQPA